MVIKQLKQTDLKYVSLKGAQHTRVSSHHERQTEAGWRAESGMTSTSHQPRVPSGEANEPAGLPGDGWRCHCRCHRCCPLPQTHSPDKRGALEPLQPLARAPLGHAPTPRTTAPGGLGSTGRPGAGHGGSGATQPAHTHCGALTHGWLPSGGSAAHEGAHVTRTPRSD